MHDSVKRFVNFSDALGATYNYVQSIRNRVEAFFATIFFLIIFIAMGYVFLAYDIGSSFQFFWGGQPEITKMVGGNPFLVFVTQAQSTPDQLVNVIKVLVFCFTFLPTAVQFMAPRLASESILFMVVLYTSIFFDSITDFPSVSLALKDVGGILYWPIVLIAVTFVSLGAQYLVICSAWGCFGSLLKLVKGVR